jgi:hypothetical protein
LYSLKFFVFKIFPENGGSRFLQNVGKYLQVGSANCLLLASYLVALFVDLQDGINTFFLNVGRILPNYTASHRQRPKNTVPNQIQNLGEFLYIVALLLGNATAISGFQIW